MTSRVKSYSYASARRWKQANLTQRRKGDPGKVRTARRLCQETTMTLAWIARRLQVGVWSQLSNPLRAD